LSLERTDLDDAITDICASDLTDTVISQLADIQNFRDELKVPLLEILSWWSNISTSVDPKNEDDRSFYEQIFQNKTVIDPDSNEFGYFTLNTERTELTGTDENLADHTATILSA